MTDQPDQPTPAEQPAEWWVEYAGRIEKDADLRKQFRADISRLTIAQVRDLKRDLDQQKAAVRHRHSIEIEAIKRVEDYLEV